MPEDAGADAIDGKYVAIGWQEMGNIFGIEVDRNVVELPQPR